MKNKTGNLALILSIPLGIYIGIYLLFIKSVIALILGFQAKELTASIITFSLIKMAITPLVTSLFILGGLSIRDSLD